MNALDIIAEVTRAGGDIRANGDRIDLEAPQPLPDDLIARIREHKVEILLALEVQSEEKKRMEEIKALSDAFYDHLRGPGKGTGCCYAPVGRYCPEGERLRDAYYRKCN